MKGNVVDMAVGLSSSAWRSDAIVTSWSRHHLDHGSITGGLELLELFYGTVENRHGDHLGRAKKQGSVGPGANFLTLPSTSSSFAVVLFWWSGS